MTIFIGAKLFQAPPPPPRMRKKCSLTLTHLGYVKMHGYHNNPVVQFLQLVVYLQIQSYLSRYLS